MDSKERTKTKSGLTLNFQLIRVRRRFVCSLRRNRATIIWTIILLYWSWSPTRYNHRVKETVLAGAGSEWRWENKSNKENLGFPHPVSLKSSTLQITIWRIPERLETSGILSLFCVRGIVSFKRRMSAVVRCVHQGGQRSFSQSVPISQPGTMYYLPITWSELRVVF